MVVQVVELGAAITSVLVTDKHGDFDDVVSGFDTVAGQYIYWLIVTVWPTGIRILTYFIMHSLFFHTHQLRLVISDDR